MWSIANSESLRRCKGGGLGICNAFVAGFSMIDKDWLRHDKGPIYRLVDKLFLTLAGLVLGGDLCEISSIGVSLFSCES